MDEGSCSAQSHFGVENMKGYRKKKLSRKSVKHPQPRASPRMTPGGNFAPGVYQAPSLTAGAYQAPSLSAGRAESEAHAMEEDHLSMEEQQETKETNEVNGNPKEEECPRPIILPPEGEEDEEHLASLRESLQPEDRKGEENDSEGLSLLRTQGETEEECLSSLREPFIEEQENSKKEASDKKKGDDGSK